jgi:uncharacterized protein (UPF0147 family)
MSSEELINETIERLQELGEDSNIPKNIKIKINNIINVLKEDKESSIKSNKALSELDEISNDPNLEAYTRTQIWNIVSILEKINQ